ncbi:acyl CoA:acetate/3-ketoacid CoA transferase [Desulfobotulus sp. H1]|uniref:Acyl CoA:acetate/3-ketoacid CoA transferase n=1 Tax=Desulfobotulus pelophilus TaxID=2823377 RepID=A0ABT3NAA8_9BACT|nr:acyl CoA:acetate/3-ketoacid CoA transferase [Desulfobotulus pelophilus]MCW7754111.1 acyl CoA:acetate/3-ketoacid CoA transferase [Desulfobotulus pelophilus]
MTQPRHPIISNLASSRVKKGKIVSAKEAIRVIRNGDTLAISGFVTTGIPEEIIQALQCEFLETGKPRDLTLVYTAGIGDRKDKGMNHLAHEGLLKRVIGGHWGLVPKLQKLAMANRIEAYNLPQGVIAHMYRDIAAGKPRTISPVGLGTFVDPRLEGGKVNACTTEDLVELIEFDGKEYLAYKTFPIHVAILRGTTADLDGNITMEKEALTLEAQAMAMAAHNSGGFVIVQVERIAERNSLSPRAVKIPGILVDCVVQASPENHWQTLSSFYNPAYSGEIRVPSQSMEDMPMGLRKVIARRAALELRANSVVNLGIGMPEGVASVAHEEKVLDYLTLTAEPGVIGGIPSGGLDFGTGINTDAIIDQPSQFDFYDGGGLDIAFLGLAQADRFGNLNVSRFGESLTGAGGFINISQNSKRVVFLGSFTAGGLDVSIDNGQLRILQEGKSKKFVRDVEQITFSGKVAAKKGQHVVYITERCVFQLTDQGLLLTEIAPGMDIEKDILSQMDFRPQIAEKLITMDTRIFLTEPMGLKKELLELPLAHRLQYQSEDNTFFVNFEGFSIWREEDILEIEETASAILAPLGHKVAAIVNYDNFRIHPELLDTYIEMVDRLVKRFYTGVTRYTTSAFMRMKLGDALIRRQVAPHIYESPEEARKALEILKP